MFEGAEESKPASLLGSRGNLDLWACVGSEPQGHCRQTGQASLTEPRGYKVLEGEGPQDLRTTGVLSISWNPAMTPVHSSFDLVPVTGDFG